MQSILETALKRNQRTLKLINSVRFFPILTILISIASTALLGKEMFEEMFVAVIVIATIVLFITSQIAALLQFNKLAKGAGKVDAAVKMLREETERENPDLNRLLQRLRSDSNRGHIHDILIRWIELAINRMDTFFVHMNESAQFRRFRSVDKIMSFHLNINKAIMKIGFLGTMYGMLIGFPPMKDAILSLQQNAGSFSFVHDIAKAIDADYIAVYCTLVATGLSILMESIIIQFLRRILSGFELVNTYLDDWNFSEFQAILRKQRGEEPKGHESGAGSLQSEFYNKMLEAQKDFQNKLMELQVSTQSRLVQMQKETEDYWTKLQSDSQVKQKEIQFSFQKDVAAIHEKGAEHLNNMQKTMMEQVKVLSDAVNMSAENVNKIIPLQKSFGDRITELCEYENQYRSFLQARAQVNIPSHLNPKG